MIMIWYECDEEAGYAEGPEVFSLHGQANRYISMCKSREHGHVSVR
jgi:hypothetical protein